MRSRKCGNFRALVRPICPQRERQQLLAGFVVSMKLTPQVQRSFKARRATVAPPFVNTGSYGGTGTQLIPVSKLLFDKVFAATVLVLISPIFLLLSLVILFEGGGPIIFRHTRIGQGGMPFSCLKFRTMKQGSQERLDQILEVDPIARKEWEESRKLYRDPRVSRLGDFLRKSSLDELPQFWNILVGDMSVVGPRPITREEARYYADNFSIYTSVRPGLTGAWQVSGRSETTYKERVDLDVRYVRSWSFLTDLRIVLKTVDVVIFGKGAC